MDKHQALLAAQEDERACVQKRYGSDLPYYWGAFVLRRAVEYCIASRVTEALVEAQQ